jgi:hypothetical protein
MKSRLVLISAIAAATAGFGVASNALASPPDAQAQAAALLSPSHSSEGVRKAESTSSVVLDAQAHAAALLSGARVDGGAADSTQVTRSSASRTSGDARAQAAALLSGARSTSVEDARTTSTREQLGAHPAVTVAKTWNNRGIDPNTFIVAHPAGVQLITAPPSESDTQLARTKESATVGGVRSGLSD